MSEETIKTIVPLDFLQQTRDRIAEQMINHPEGKDIVIEIVRFPQEASMRIEDGKDIMSIPDNYLQMDGPYWRTLITYTMYLMMSEWYGTGDYSERIGNIGNYIAFNSDVVFAEWGEDNAGYPNLHSPGNTTWHDYARNGNAEENRLRQGYMNWLLQVCRIIQQKLHLRLADGWNLSYGNESVRGRIIRYTEGATYKTIVCEILKYGVPTDDWKHWPVSDMLRRSETLIRLVTSTNIPAMFPDYRKYLDDPEYKRECLMKFEYDLDSFLSNMWDHIIPTQETRLDPYIEEGPTTHVIAPDLMYNNTPEVPSDDSTSSAGSPFPTLE